MKTHRVIQLLTICVLLLAGISFTLYYQLNQSTVSAEALKAEILAELRAVDAAHIPEDGQRLPSAKSGPAHSDAGEPQNSAEANNSPKLPAAPLSKIEYWISMDFSDEKPNGFATWIELVENGHFIIEHCLAPDYSGEVTATQEPFQTVKCKTLADTRIKKISESEIVLNSGKMVPVHLAGSTETPTLSLTLGDHKVELVPGQKNTLSHGLSSLTSVKEAYKLALDKYMQLKGKTKQQ